MPECGRAGLPILICNLNLRDPEDFTMKRLICTVCALSLCAVLLAGCGGDASSSAPSSSSAATSSSEAADSTASEDSTTAESGDTSAETADTARLDAIVAAIEAVNPVENPRAIDDNTLTYDMYLTTDNIVAYKGDVTNNQSDCALVFAAQVKEGTADQVVEELTAYRDGLASNDMYVEFADKVAKSADARIVSSGNFVVMVIAGVNGPDYAEIDTAIESALA